MYLVYFVVGDCFACVKLLLSPFLPKCSDLTSRAFKTHCCGSPEVDVPQINFCMFEHLYFKLETQHQHVQGKFFQQDIAQSPISCCLYLSGCLFLFQHCFVVFYCSENFFDKCKQLPYSAVVHQGQFIHSFLLLKRTMWSSQMIWKICMQEQMLTWSWLGFNISKALDLLNVKFF